MDGEGVWGGVGRVDTGRKKVGVTIGVVHRYGGVPHIRRIETSKVENRMLYVEIRRVEG